MERAKKRRWIIAWAAGVAYVMLIMGFAIAHRSPGDDDAARPESGPAGRNARVSERSGAGVSEAEGSSSSGTQVQGDSSGDGLVVQTEIPERFQATPTPTPIGPPPPPPPQPPTPKDVNVTSSSIFHGSPFHGKVLSAPPCKGRRKVTVIQRPGGKIGSVQSRLGGRWRLNKPHRDEGRAFARVKRKVTPTTICRAGRSRTISLP